MHWARPYIGMPVADGGRGPVEVDCWGLLRLIYLREFNLLLPELPGISVASVMERSSEFDKSMGDWVEVQKPFDGAAVGLSQNPPFMHHVGIYTTADGGKIVHAWKDQHVIADTLQGLRLKGFRTIKFYKHAQWPT